MNTKKIKLDSKVQYRPIVISLKVAAEFIAAAFSKPRTLMDAYHYRRSAIILLQNAIPKRHNVSPEEVYDLTVSALARRRYAKTRNAFFIAMVEAKDDEFKHYLKYDDKHSDES